MQPHNCRDENTPDVFHKFTEDELNNIATKLLTSPKIKKRFGEYITLEENLEFVRQFLIQELENDPQAFDVFYKWRNFKIAQKANRA